MIRAVRAVAFPHSQEQQPPFSLFFSLFNLPTPGEMEFWSLLTCCTNLDIPFGGTGIRDPFECLFCI